MLFSPATPNGCSGVGTRLVNEGLRACTEAGYDIVVVLGHPGYYPRFGFEPSLNYGIRLVYDVPPEVFLVRALRAGALQGVSGTAGHHPVIDEL